MRNIASFSLNLLLLDLVYSEKTAYCFWKDLWVTEFAFWWTCKMSVSLCEPNLNAPVEMSRGQPHSQSEVAEIQLESF